MDQQAAEGCPGVNPVHTSGEHERPWPVTVKIPPALLDRLDQAARAEDVARSVLVREMVEDGLNRLQAGAGEPGQDSGRRRSGRRII